MRAPGFWWRKSGATAALLSPLAAIYGSVAGRRLAQSGARAGVPVICIGNPTVGSAGKTPTAIAVARLLIGAGERPLAFAGIGAPEKCFARLAAAGINAQIQRGFASHNRYRADEAAALLAEAELHVQAIATTEKDLARLQGDSTLAALAARVEV